MTAPPPDAVLAAGDVLIGVGSARRDPRARAALRAPGDRRWLTPCSALADALSAAAGAPVALERPARLRPRRLRDERRAAARRAGGRPPREIAEELAAALPALDGVARCRRWPGRGSSTSTSTTAGSPARSRRCSRRATTSAAALPRRAERVQVEMVSANPTGPMTVASARNGAYGDCVARLLAFAGHTVEREYYYNDAGAPDGQVPRLGRGRAPRRGAARGRLSAATTSPRSRRRRAIRCRACSR